MDSLKEQVPPMEIRRFRGQYVMEPVEMKPSYGQVSLAYLPDSLIRDTLRYEYAKIKEFLCKNLRYLRTRMMAYIRKHIELFY